MVRQEGLNVKCRNFYLRYLRLVTKEAVEKLRCILSLPHPFSSLARRFACCQSCSVSAPFGLTTLAKSPLKGPDLDGLTEQSAKL